MLGQIVRGQNDSGLQHDTGRHEFTPPEVRDPENCYLANRRMLIDDRFDLAGINIFAACDDHVLHAVENVEIAVRILIADVSGAEHSVSKCESRVFRIVPVPPHDIGAPCDQFTVLRDFHFFSRFVLDSQVNSWAGSSTRQEFGVDMLLIFETREKACFAESVALKEFHLRQKLPRPANQFRRHWRTAIGQNFEATQVIRLCLGKLRQQVQHRGYEHSVSYALALDRLTESLWAELRNRGLAGTEGRSCEHGGEICNVKNRSRVQIDATLSVAHPIIEVVNVRQDVGVTHHDALWSAGSAAGVDESHDCFGIINRIWTKCVQNLQGVFVDHELPRKLYSGIRERGMPYQSAGFRINQ